jgi:L-alanine-DL-glutamate epimerase-like enolase superfamily enzyme
MADEPISCAKDVIDYAMADAADLVKVKVNKCGGLRKTSLLCETARIFDIGVIIGSGHESSIGVAAESALALTQSNFNPVGEMNGNQRLVNEWVRMRFSPVRGRLNIWSRPGLGLEVSPRNQKERRRQ